MTEGTVTRSEELASFLDIGLDLTTDTVTGPEREQVLAWYREKHGHGGVELAPFAGFLLEHDPATFKRLRRHLLALGRDLDGPPLPIAVVVLLFVHTYVVLGIGKGALYEIVAARALGATRAEVFEVVALAALNGGPRGVNALAEVADEYHRDWHTDDGAPGVRWPDGWAQDVAALRSGIDLASDELEPGELELIRDWYRRTGEVPDHVDLLGAIAPAALKTQRARFETAVRGAVPAQLVPLLTAHLSAIRLWPTPLRRSLATARALGVRRSEAISTLLWAAVYGGDVVMETAVDAARDLLASWDEGQ